MTSDATLRQAAEMIGGTITTDAIANAEEFEQRMIALK